MKQAAWIIGALIAGFFAGYFSRRRASNDPETAPISVVDLMRLYEQIRRDVLDDIERDKTIEKLRKRLGI